jgi:signal peptidase I
MDNRSKQPMSLSVPYWDVAPRTVTGQAPRHRRSSWELLLFETLETVALAVLIWFVVNFATARFIVDGSSMEPNFHSGQLVIVNRLAYRFGTLERGDVIVFRYPLNTADDYIKRIIGLPGETISISDNEVYVNGQLLQEPYLASDAFTYNGQWSVPSDSYFVMGDNRAHSSDSRSWGMLDSEFIIGKAWISYWPPEDWGVIPHYGYGSSSANSPGTIQSGQ